MNKTVSIVMPVYNPNISYLQKSIESILSQTYNNIELIIVYDRSSTKRDDLILKILRGFYDDDRLRLIVNRNKLGFIRSLNKGIKLSDGEYIGRMDDDDISSSDRIVKQVEILQQKKLDIVGCWSNVINRNDKTLGYLHPPIEWHTIRKYLLFHHPFVHSSILFKRRIINTIGMYHTGGAEDYDFYLRAFSAGFKGANIPIYLHSYREHSISLHYTNWKHIRVAYLRRKLNAVSKYGFKRPLDLIFLGLTPLCILVKPSNVLLLKKLVGLYKGDVKV